MNRSLDIDLQELIPTKIQLLGNRGGDSLIDVCKDIVDVFDADGEADEFGRDAAG